MFKLVVGSMFVPMFSLRLGWGRVRPRVEFDLRSVQVGSGSRPRVKSWLSLGSGRVLSLG